MPEKESVCRALVVLGLCTVLLAENSAEMQGLLLCPETKCMEIL